MVHLGHQLRRPAPVDPPSRKAWFRHIPQFLDHPRRPAGLAFAVAGILAIGIASALYISTGLGPGPRDGWMMGIHRRSGVRVGRVRLAIETVVLTAGFLLGGRVGLGTALFALFIGQSIAISCGVLARLTHQ
jgi:uncharacterized membrane protein YczE